MSRIYRLLIEAEEHADAPPPRIRAAMKSLLQGLQDSEPEEEPPPSSPPSEGERSMHLDWDFRNEEEIEET